MLSLKLNINKIIACILIAVCVGGALLIVDPPSTKRLTVWRVMAFYIRQHMMTGSSIGNFRHTFRIFYSVDTSIIYIADVLSPTKVQYYTYVKGGKYAFWKDTLEQVDKIPGDGNRYIVYHQAHNEYLQVLYEMGIIGLIPVLGYLITTFWQGIRNLKVIIPLTAIVIIAVNSVYNFPFHVATTALVAVTWMAIFHIKMRTE